MTPFATIHFVPTGMKWIFYATYRTSTETLIRFFSYSSIDSYGSINITIFETSICYELPISQQ